MILTALYDYYNRTRKAHPNRLPVFGKEYKEIGFLLVIDEEGNFIRFEDRRRTDGRTAQSFLVKKAVGRTSAPAANTLYDNSQYVFCYSDKGTPEQCKKYYDVFKTAVRKMYEAAPEDRHLRALNKFYETDIALLHDRLKADLLWEEVEKNLNKKFSNFSFLMEGETRILAEMDPLLSLLPESENGTLGTCLITGEKGVLVETTTASMIPGSQATAKLVSFQVKSGYDSYGKEKGLNAPISQEAEFAYTTALNYLLRSDSPNKFKVGNRSFVFWASAEDEACRQAEESLSSLLSFQKEDDPDKGINQVRKVFDAIYSGTLQTSLDDRFYLLGLAPNAARIAVVYWAEIPLKEFAGRILQHFTDMEIVGQRAFSYMGLYSILSTVTLGGKSSDVTPNLPDSVVKSIFNGTPYPYTLFSNCIRRIRAESSENDSIYQGRAAILKAFLNRTNQQKPIQLMLDKENTNAGYLCGRLFAVLDKIQERANQQHSIRERYLNAASSTPSAVFATILNLSSHHAEKLTEGTLEYFEKIKQEIIGKMPPAGFPSNLSLQDQGRFFIGFYHQKQDFFTSNAKEQ